MKTQCSKCTHRDEHCAKAQKDMNNSEFGQAVTEGTVNKAQEHSGHVNKIKHYRADEIT